MAGRRFSWGKLWVGVGVIVALALAIGFTLQLLDINLVTSLVPVDPDDPAPYG